MLFYLGTSIGRRLQANDQETIDFVVRLLDSRKRGMLLVHASKTTFLSIESFFRNCNREHEADLVLTLSKNGREMRQVVRDLSKIVYVSDLVKGGVRNRAGKICIAPSQINKTNLLYPPIFLAENHSDCDLYSNVIAKNFNRGLPSSISGLRISDRFESGGGNTTHEPYRRHKKKGVDLCLCIVDSDRSCPAEGVGDTAKRVLDVDKAGGISALCESMVIDMYSAENLLPFSILKEQYVIGKNAEQISAFENVKKIREKESWVFLPLKKGLSGSDLKSSCAKGQYWANQMHLLGLAIPCCVDDPCTCTIVPAVGSKTLVNALKTETDGWKETLNAETNPNLIAAYRQIALAIKSWFCVGNEIRL